jgi:hypothetical protein
MEEKHGVYAQNSALQTLEKGINYTKVRIKGEIIRNYLCNVLLSNREGNLPQSGKSPLAAMPDGCFLKAGQGGDGESYRSFLQS